MDVDYILYLSRHTMETAFIVALPLLLTCMIVGICVSLFQTITQLRDMTLTLVPKLLAMAIASLTFGAWMMQMIMKFTMEIFNQIEAYGRM